MAIARTKIAPCLWFDSQAEEAAKFYASVFKNSRIGRIARYGKSGKEIHGRDEGSVMTVEFELEGQPFVGLNGGPHFKFTEAVSFQIYCDTQDEIDYYWDALRAGGGEEGPCGWLKDRFGLSWQVAPAVIADMMQDKDRSKADRAMAALLQMRKLDIAALQKAYDGK
jgi:predicted 3-demethylubiquinone-9 3-methyltransferase (glyoxalase superfamily)